MPSSDQKFSLNASINASFNHISKNNTKQHFKVVSFTLKNGEEIVKTFKHILVADGWRGISSLYPRINYPTSIHKTVQETFDHFNLMSKDSTHGFLYYAAFRGFRSIELVIDNDILLTNLTFDGYKIYDISNEVVTYSNIMDIEDASKYIINKDVRELNGRVKVLNDSRVIVDNDNFFLNDTPFKTLDIIDVDTLIELNNGIDEDSPLNRNTTIYVIMVCIIVILILAYIRR
jgi:hypothetical protein